MVLMLIPYIFIRLCIDGYDTMNIIVLHIIINKHNTDLHILCLLMMICSTIVVGLLFPICILISS